MESKIDATKLVNEHGDYLLSFAMSKIRDRELSKDLVQDTFVSALSKIESFENRSNLRTWLTSILHRKIIDYWRKAETRYTDPISYFFDQNNPKRAWLENKSDSRSISNIESQISERETLNELNDCLEKLPAKWKGIIVSKYLNETETEVICKDFGISTSNLWVIIHRAKLQLRDCLKKKWSI